MLFDILIEIHLKIQTSWVSFLIIMMSFLLPFLYITDEEGIEINWISFFECLKMKMSKGKERNYHKIFAMFHNFMKLIFYEALMN